MKKRNLITAEALNFIFNFLDKLVTVNFPTEKPDGTCIFNNTLDHNSENNSVSFFVTRSELYS